MIFVAFGTNTGARFFRIFQKGSFLILSEYPENERGVLGTIKYESQLVPYKFPVFQSVGGYSQ